MPVSYELMKLVSVAAKVRITAQDKRLADEIARRDAAFMQMEAVNENVAEPTTTNEVQCDEFVIIIPQEERLIADQIFDNQGLTRLEGVAKRKKKNVAAVKRNSKESILLQLADESELTLMSETTKESKNGSRKSHKRGVVKEKRKASVTFDDPVQQPPPVKLTLRLGRKTLPTEADDSNASTADRMDEWAVQQSATEESRQSPSKRSRRASRKEQTTVSESEWNIASTSAKASSYQGKESASTITTEERETRLRPHLPPQQDLITIVWAYPLHAFVVLKKDIRVNPDRPRYIYRVCEDKLKRYNRIADGYQIDFLDVEGYENIMLEDKVQSNPDLFESIDVIDSEAITVHLKKRVPSPNVSTADSLTSYEAQFEETLVGLSEF